MAPQHATGGGNPAHEEGVCRDQPALSCRRSHLHSQGCGQGRDENHRLGRSEQHADMRLT
eukprot:82808-Hanusia_phi.AAC.2